MSRSLKVLLCDDSRALRMVTAQLLMDQGFEVAGEAVDGRDAVDKYQQLRPDAVLLDLVMPNCDGKQALAEILAFDPAAKVVILSSLGAQSDIEECLQAGARTYLQKPIDPDALKRVLNELAD
jgi:two-component system, chemotaxis family, chemotaxis protein CheY